MSLTATDNKARILIVEDDRDLNNLLKFTFENTKDYIVLSHFEGNNAFALIQETHPDLVILDVMLPGQFGTEVLRRIRQDSRTKDLPVIKRWTMCAKKCAQLWRKSFSTKVSWCWLGVTRVGCVSFQRTQPSNPRTIKK